jgi:hypothetical protein
VPARNNINKNRPNCPPKATRVRFIEIASGLDCARLYHFVIVVWRAKEAQSRMTTVRLQSALLFAAWFVVIRIASAEAQTVVVGGTTIALPSPEGFFRYDGKNTKVDSLEQQLVPKSNRLLAAFGSEEMLAEVLADRFPAKGRWFNAQSLCERMNC